MPTATLNAFREHGKPNPHALKSDVAAARQTLDAFDQLGIPLRAITAELLDDGVRKFSNAFDELLDAASPRGDVSLLLEVSRSMFAHLREEIFENTLRLRQLAAVNGSYALTVLAFQTFCG